jgi:hypothetical protein
VDFAVIGVVGVVAAHEMATRSLSSPTVAMSAVLLSALLYAYEDFAQWEESCNVHAIVHVVSAIGLGAIASS